MSVTEKRNEGPERPKIGQGRPAAITLPRHGSGRAAIRFRLPVASQNTSWGWKPHQRRTGAIAGNAAAYQIVGRAAHRIAPPVVWQRLYLASLMIMNCTAQLPMNATERVRAAVMDNVFSVAAAALSASIDESVGEAMIELYKRYIARSRDSLEWSNRK